MIAVKNREIMGNTLVAKIIDLLPNPVFLVDTDLQIYHINVAALKAIQGSDLERAFSHRSKDLQCASRKLASAERSQACQTCSLRGAVLECLSRQSVVQQSVQVMRGMSSKTDVGYFQLTVSPFVTEGYNLALVSLKDESEIVELRSLLPICPRCERSHVDDKALQERMKAYLSAHPEAQGGTLCHGCQKGLETPEHLRAPTTGDEPTLS